MTTSKPQPTKPVRRPEAARLAEQIQRRNPGMSETESQTRAKRLVTTRTTKT